MLKFAVRAALTGTLLVATWNVAAADPVADFYRDKTVFLQIGSAAGGFYDVTGRIVARYIGKYIPGNPRVVPQNVPGGGSLQLANQFASIAARDGTVLGIFNSGMPTTPLVNPKVGKFDPRKFNFLGSPSREFHMLISWHTGPAKTIEDTFTKELIVGATAPGAAPYDFPQVTNAVLGTKFKMIRGYQGGQATQLAMQRGEIHGNAGIAWSSVKTDFTDALRNKEILLIGGFGFRKHPELPDLPMFPTGKNPEERQLFELLYARQSYGRLFAMPPDVPAARVAAMRQALEATMKNADYLAESKRSLLDTDPVSADELTQVTERLYSTPPAVVALMQQLLE